MRRTARGNIRAARRGDADPTDAEAWLRLYEKGAEHRASPAEAIIFADAGLAAFRRRFPSELPPQPDAAAAQIPGPKPEKVS